MARKIEVEVTGDTRSLERALGRATKTSQSSFAKIGKAAKLGGLAIAAGLAYGAKRGLDELSESQKVLAQTEAVLKSTGGAAKVTADDVDTLATSLSRMSGVDDELIGKSENLLLTFTNVKNEVGKGNRVFDDATKAILDMSVATGTDLQSATLQVGKALQDPVRGLSALRRVGVAFTAGQEKTIKKLVESGDVMGAQKIILKELNKEFGGSAKAAGETLPGQLAKARNAFDEIAGEVMARTLPAITFLLEGMLKLMDWVKKNWPRFQEIIGQAIEKVRPYFEQLVDFWNNSLLPAIDNVVRFARELWKRFGDDVTRVFGAVVGIIQNFLNIAVGIIEVVLALIRGDWSAAWEAIKKIARNALDAIVTYVRAVGETLLNAAKALGNLIKTGLMAGLRALPGLVWGLMKQIPGKIRDLLGIAKNAAGDLGRGIKNGILDAMSGLASSVGSLVRSAINAAIDAFNALADFKIDPPGPGSISVNFPNIPHVATGGDISRSGLAVVHQGERVLPAKVVRRGDSPSSPAGGLRYVVLANQEVVNMLRDLDSQERRRSGGRGIL